MLALLAMLVLAHAGGVEGRYALEMRVRSTSTVPLARTTSTEVTTALVDVAQGPEGLLHRQRTCDIDIESRSLVARPLIPDAFVARLPPSSRAVILNSTPAGTRYRVDLGLAHVGYDASRGETLPTSATDPAVIDWEGDGRPGATVLVHVFGLGTFGIDVVQRTRVILDGEVGADGVIAGRVRTAVLEHHVLGADRRFLEANPQVVADPEASTFRMVPVPADTTCDDLAGRRRVADRTRW